VRELRELQELQELRDPCFGAGPKLNLVTNTRVESDSMGEIEVPADR
jgi:hypothetical protein